MLAYLSPQPAQASFYMTVVTGSSSTACLASQLELALLNSLWSPSEYLRDTKFNCEVPGAVMPM